MLSSRIERTPARADDQARGMQAARGHTIHSTHRRWGSGPPGRCVRSLRVRARGVTVRALRHGAARRGWGSVAARGKGRRRS
jgi:hypothetical protein